MLWKGWSWRKSLIVMASIWIALIVGSTSVGAFLAHKQSQQQAKCLAAGGNDAECGVTHQGNGPGSYGSSSDINQVDCSKVTTFTAQCPDYGVPSQPTYQSPQYTEPQPQYQQPQYQAPQPSYQQPQYSFHEPSINSGGFNYNTNGSAGDGSYSTGTPSPQSSPSGTGDFSGSGYSGY
jgi:hypothetical protein